MDLAVAQSDTELKRSCTELKLEIKKLDECESLKNVFQDGEGWMEKAERNFF
jgi:hypothetical protein